MAQAMPAAETAARYLREYAMGLRSELYRSTGVSGEQGYGDRPRMWVRDGVPCDVAALPAHARNLIHRIESVGTAVDALLDESVRAWRLREREV